MLVLSRKTHEEICIGSNIHVTVVAIQGGKVKIGIEAPREVPVHRKEVQQRRHSDAEVIPAKASRAGIA